MIRKFFQFSFICRFLLNSANVYSCLLYTAILLCFYIVCFSKIVTLFFLCILSYSYYFLCCVIYTVFVSYKYSSQTFHIKFLNEFMFLFIYCCHSFVFLFIRISFFPFALCFIHFSHQLLLEHDCCPPLPL